MWWLEHRLQPRRLIRLAVVLAAASLTAGCFEPLYGTHATLGGVPDSVHTRLAAVDIATIKAPLGSPVERIAVGMRNALQFDLHGGNEPAAPTHRLVVNVGTTQWTVRHRPDQRAAGCAGRFGRRLLQPDRDRHRQGRRHRYDRRPRRLRHPRPRTAVRQAARATQRRGPATKVVAEAIRNRLASYFVAGT